MSKSEVSWEEWFTKTFGSEYETLGDVLEKVTEGVNERLLKVRSHHLTGEDIDYVLGVVKHLLIAIDQADELLVNVGNKGAMEKINLMEYYTTKHFSEKETDIEIITPEEVQELLRPKEDGLLKEAAEVVKEVVKGNLTHYMLNGYYDVYLSQAAYPEKIVQRLGEMLEQAGWDVRLSSQNPTRFGGDPSTRLVLKFKCSKEVK